MLEYVEVHNNRSLTAEEMASAGGWWWTHGYETGQITNDSPHVASEIAEHQRAKQLNPDVKLLARMSPALLSHTETGVNEWPPRGRHSLYRNNKLKLEEARVLREYLDLGYTIQRHPWISQDMLREAERRRVPLYWQADTTAKILWPYKPTLKFWEPRFVDWVVERTVSYVNKIGADGVWIGLKWYLFWGDMYPAPEARLVWTADGSEVGAGAGWIVPMLLGPEAETGFWLILRRLSLAGIETIMDMRGNRVSEDEIGQVPGVLGKIRWI